MKALTMFLLIALASVGLLAQTSPGEPDVRRRLEMIERGQGQMVEAELQQLMTTYQNNPGVMFLQGVLTTDGTEAAKIYQSIVDNFPKSEWADDALFRLYQYYASVGLYKTAEQKLAQLKLEYPFSAYATEEPDTKPIAQGSASVSTSPDQPTETPVVLQPQGSVQKFSTTFTIQVGAFSTMSNAEELKKRFEKEGYVSNIFTITRDGKKLHKVWVGEFQKQEDARMFIREVKKKFGLDAIVVSR
jgi:cell division protein FtsN